jgi:hypothetical protein
MIATEQQVKTIRTTPLPDIATMSTRIDDVRVACERNGRDPGSLVIAAAGAWPMLDVREGLDVDASLARVAALEAIGVDWVMVNCCGDDASASVDTVRQFGEQIIGPSTQLGLRHGVRHGERC